MAGRRTGAASVSKMTSGQFRVRWDDPVTGRDRSKRFQLRREADRFAKDLNTTIARDEYVDPRAGTITLRDYAEESWRPRQAHRESTQELVERNLRLHVYPVLGDMQLRAIRPVHVDQLKKQLLSKIAPSTARVTYRYFVSIMLAAQKDRLIATSPTVGIKAPTVPPTVVRPLTTAQVKSIAEHVGARYRALVFLGAFTGARRSELIAVTIDRVDLEHATLTIDRQLISANGNPVHGPLKTRASYRAVPLPAAAVEVLREHIATYTDGGPNELVFTNFHGHPLKRSAVNALWSNGRDAAGLPTANFHDLRHYYASLLIRRGLSVRTVQARLGHATAEETLKTYSHLWPDSDEHTRNVIDMEFGDWGTSNVRDPARGRWPALTDGPSSSWPESRLRSTGIEQSRPANAARAGLGERPQGSRARPASTRFQD